MPKDLSFMERKIKLNNLQETILLSLLKLFTFFYIYKFSFRGFGRIQQ